MRPAEGHGAVSYRVVIVGEKKQIFIVTDSMNKPWVAVDEILDLLHIDRDTIDSTVYSYIFNGVEERFIQCQVTLKPGTNGMLTGNPQ